ncbi:hypothetical protein DB30_04282 [Enhygromyxa salina]|uniref:Uncharacterized protein n=2 Tax=Enhygromyxa salina TaxID=215803 RepID=A0A0C1ZZS4_9BACT|nr:hypothetical protein DB30_04282 [Enhygromyxa salina]
MLSPGLLACDDDKAKNDAGDRKSVIEGGKAESEPGKQLERAKQEIDATEKQMQDRADENFEKSGGEKVERGLP